MRGHDSRGWRRLSAVLVLGLLSGAPLTFAQPAAAEASVSWSIAPARSEGADGRVSIRATVEPGEVVTEHVEVSNLSDEPLSLTLTSADGIITDEGDFDVVADGSVSTRAGRWFSLMSEVAVEPRSSVVVPITITVPADALPGDHPAGVVATPTRASHDDSVAVVARTGVRVHLRVAGEITPALTPQITALEYEPNWNPFEPGRLRVAWEATNTGNVRLGGAPALTVSGLGGLVPQVENERLEQFRELLPGGQRSGVVTVDAWPLFALTADAAVMPTVVGEDVIGAPLLPGAGSATVVAVPWAQMIVALGVLGIVIMVARRVRAPRRSAASD